jgi:hypothetical protein
VPAHIDLADSIVHLSVLAMLLEEVHHHEHPGGDALLDLGEVREGAAEHVLETVGVRVDPGGDVTHPVAAELLAVGGDRPEAVELVLEVELERPARVAGGVDDVLDPCRREAALREEAHRRRDNRLPARVGVIAAPLWGNSWT